MEPRASNILQVIERQCRLWELQREEQRRKARTPEHWPVITVSREFGARGEFLAHTIGERIGFTVWDGELVHAVADQTGANEAVLRSLDEHRRRVIEDSIEGALLGGQYMESEYLRRLMKVMHAIASHGRAIVVGRGAEYILDPKSILRLRVVCPFEERARGYGIRQRIGETEARHRLEKEDAERTAFIRQNFSRKLSSAADFDLVVNTGSLPIEKLVGVVLGAYEAKFGRRPPDVSLRADSAVVEATPTSAR